MSNIHEGGGLKVKAGGFSIFFFCQYVQKHLHSENAHHCQDAVSHGQVHLSVVARNLVLVLVTEMI